MYIALCKIHYYVDNDHPNEVDYIGISNVASYVEAMERVEAYYEQDLMSCEIELLDETFIRLNEEMFQKIRDDAL